MANLNFKVHFFTKFLCEKNLLLILKTRISCTFIAQILDWFIMEYLKKMLHFKIICVLLDALSEQWSSLQGKFWIKCFNPLQKISGICHIVQTNIWIRILKKILKSIIKSISCFPIKKYLVLRSYIMKNIAPNIIEEMSGNSICQESPGKHPGKEHLLRFWIKEACFRIKTFLTKVVGIILAKARVCKKNAREHTGNTRERSIY